VRYQIFLHYITKHASRCCTSVRTQAASAVSKRRRASTSHWFWHLWKVSSFKR